MEIITLVLGPVETNTYIVADPASREAVVIDPAWEGEQIARRASQHGWTIRQIWLTHAHFDHLAGAAGIVKQLEPAPPVALHPQDFPLWSAEWRRGHVWPAGGCRSPPIYQAGGGSVVDKSAA